MRKISIIIAISIAVFLVSCAGQKGIAKPQPANVETVFLIDTLLARETMLDGIVGRASVKVETPTIKASFTANYYFSFPDTLRADLKGFLGVNAGAIISIGDSMTAFFPGRDTLFIAVGEPKNVNPIIGLQIGFGDLARSFIGLSDARRDGDSVVSVSEMGNSFEVVISRSGEFIRLEIDRETLTLNSRQVFSADGLSALDVAYLNYEMNGKFYRPRIIQITNPIRHENVVIKIEKESIGKVLPDDIFKLPIPEGLPVWQLE